MPKWLDRSCEALRTLLRPGQRERKLAALQRELSSRFAGKRCLVLGSAPAAVAPTPNRFDACICVNGSGWTAKTFGIESPDLTVVVGHKTQVRDQFVAKATVQAWQGLRTHMLLFVAIGDTPRHARSVFAKADFHYESFVPIDPEERAIVIEAVCGKKMATRGSRISNGTFAAALVMWAGAKEIIFSGFSMSGGHSYIEGETRRGHQEGDGQFFRWASENPPCPVTTTSPELHRDFGLPLAG